MNGMDLSSLSIEDLLKLQAEAAKRIRQDPTLKTKQAQILARQQAGVRTIRDHAAGLTNALDSFADAVAVEDLTDAATIVSPTSPDFGKSGKSVALAAVKRGNVTYKVTAFFGDEV